MFDELKIYTRNGSFAFSPSQSLREVCNAPKDSSGIYIVYAFASNAMNIIYIGSSGKIKNDGTVKHRQGGIYDRIVNGKQFDQPRKKTWPLKIMEENIERLQIFWYETFNEQVSHIPTFAESLLIQKYFDIYGCLPRWNKEF